MSSNRKANGTTASNSVYSLQLDPSKHPVVLPAGEIQNYTFSEQTKGDGSVGKKRKLYSREENVTFEASSTTSRSVRLADSCNFAVGSFQKDSQTLILHSATPAEVKIVLNGESTSRPSLQPSLQHPSQKRTFQDYVDARNLLSETFGTKKKKQQLRLERSNAINIETIQHEAYSIKSQISSSSNLADGNQSEIEDVAVEFQMHQEKPIPPYKPNASEPSQVYNIAAIAPPELLNWLDKEMIQSRLATLLPSVANLLESKSGNQTEMERLVFLDFMILFFVSVPKSKIELTKISEIISDSSVMNFLLATFARKLTFERYEMGTANKDKLLFYICVLFLHLSGYSNVPIGQLANDLKVSAHKLILYFRSLGCKSTKASASASGDVGSLKNISLTVPLKFPIIRKK